jgi:IS5 family transposase
VLRTVSGQPTLWDAILPSELLVLPAELGRVDALLDDPVFFAPFAAYFDARIGRPSIPMETYLRLMFLKFRYRLGYESLRWEVADSISWQRFCRIPLGMRVPHPTTLMKISSRCGDEAVAGLNEALLVKAAAGKLLRTDRVRADTTVACADVGYPTDSGLFSQAVGTMCRTVARIKAAGGAVRTRAGDRCRSTGRRARAIASKSADAAIGGGFAGALTYHLVAALTESSTPLSYRELHDQTCAKLKQAPFRQVLRHGEEGRRVSPTA